MEPNAATVAGSGSAGRELDETGLESLQFGEEIQRLMTVPPENAGSFTALLGLPPTQAMELLHSSDSGRVTQTAILSGNPLHPGINDDHKRFFDAFNNNLTFPSDTALTERAAKFSVFAGEFSPENASPVPSISSGNLEKVKSEPPTETDSNPNPSLHLVSDPMVENTNQPSAKRKEREKKGKGSTKKGKNESPEDAEKLPYVHVRARRGQATDSHSLAERARREKINARMKLLQELVPGCNKISGTALVLDEIINHVQSLQRQVEFLSMKLAAVDPRIDLNLDAIIASENGSPVDGGITGMVMPLMWPEVSFGVSRHPYQQQWQCDVVQQPVWAGEEANHNFTTLANSPFSYESANSASSARKPIEERVLKA